MSAMFKISIVLNVVLVALLVWSLAGGGKPASVEGPPAGSEPATGESVTGVVDVAQPAPAAEDARPFRWSQIESTDYHAYIRNLRGIGCPELTIRDIITADVHNLFTARARELERKLGEPAKGSLDIVSKSALESELRRLPEEEAELVAELLGLQQTPSGPGGPSPEIATATEPPEEQPVSMPLAFANVDVASLKLDESQMQVLGSLRQKFLAEIGGKDQDPNDPAYRARWQKAQPKVDNQLKGMIGINAFQQYDLVARASRRAAQTP